MRMLGHRVSPAAVIALVALAVALGGTSYAAVRLPANSVGTRQLKANAVTSLKVKNRSLGRADLKANLLLPGPQGPQGPPGPAGPAGAAGAAGANGSSDAFSHFLNGPVVVPTTATTLTSLAIPSGGKYVVFAKAYFASSSATLVNVTCTLEAGADVDQGATYAGAPVGYPLQLNVVHEYAAAGTADFKCAVSGAASESANFIKITAVKVANLTNSG